MASLQAPATRDQELERTVRAYLQAARSAFARASVAHGAAGDSDYDPARTWRTHTRTALEMTDISARASLLAEHLRALAPKLEVDLGAPGALGSRGERLSLYVSLFDCVHADAGVRAAHAAALVRDLGEAPPSLTPDEVRELARREIMMLRETMRCTALAGKRRLEVPEARASR